MKLRPLLAAALLLWLLPACNKTETEPARPRVIVTTDGEIDDECSLVRFLLYCNEWDVEAIVTSSSQYHWRGHKWAGDDWMDTVMGAYAEVYPNLRKHDRRYPSPEFLRSRSYLGNVDAEGEMEQMTDGARRIVEVLLDSSDPRPVWVQAWGGTNTLARALKTIQEEHPEKMEEVAAKLCLFNIWEQDSTYQSYIRPNWEPLGIMVIISDQFEAIAYRWHTAQVEQNWKWLDSEWMKKWILSVEPLGNTYRACNEGEWFNPTNVSETRQEGGFPVVEGDFRSEGDSPSFMYTIPTGMNFPEHPDWGSWGGRYVRVRNNVWMDPVPDSSWEYPEGRISSANTWGRLTLKGKIEASKEQVEEYFRPMARWTEAFQNDFAARMSWTVLPYKEANHEPVVRPLSKLEQTVLDGESVELKVKATDPDGDKLTYKWWQYSEAGSSPAEVEIVSDGADATVKVPANAPAGSIHIICEVSDDGSPSLTRYARFVLNVRHHYWLGADISTANGMKARGEMLKNFEGEQGYELTALMKELGLDAARFRVWVNPRRRPRPGTAESTDPHAGSCDSLDLLANCLMAKELGMEVMLCIHYSDTWADPKHQPIPAEWMGHDYPTMLQDLYDYTHDVLELLKKNGVTPKWVQVGNETRNGLLWNPSKEGDNSPAGKLGVSEHMGHSVLDPEQYAGFIQAGCRAAKEVFPDCITIVHLDNGYDSAMYDWNLGLLEKYGTEYDMVGMSLYPYWAALEGGRDDADGVIDDCIANIKHVWERFGKESMIVETGFEVNENDPVIMEEGYRQLTRAIVGSRDNADGHCHGIFYWAPEARPRPGQATGGYRLGAFGSDDRPTKIMRAFVEQSKVMQDR